MPRKTVVVRCLSPFFNRLLAVRHIEDVGLGVWPPAARTRWIVLVILGGYRDGPTSKTRPPAAALFPQPSSSLLGVTPSDWPNRQRNTSRFSQLLHRTFVLEVRQDADTGTGRLIDKFHHKNTYIVAVHQRRICGMVAVHDQPPFSAAGCVSMTRGLWNGCARSSWKREGSPLNPPSDQGWSFRGSFGQCTNTPGVVATGTS